MRKGPGFDRDCLTLSKQTSFKYFLLLHRVDWYRLTDVLKKRNAFEFRVKDFAVRELSNTEYVGATIARIVVTFTC